MRFNIRVLDFTCIHPPTPNPQRNLPPTGDSSPGRRTWNPSPSIFLPRNCTPIRPFLFPATPSNRVLFNWWNVSARNAHTHNFSLSSQSRLHFSTVVSSNFEGIVPSFVYESIVDRFVWNRGRFRNVGNRVKWRKGEIPALLRRIDRFQAVFLFSFFLSFHLRASKNNDSFVIEGIVTEWISRDNC